MNICLFTKKEISKPLDIRDPRAQHIIKILHKNVNDSFSAGIIDGEAGTATITAIDTHEEQVSDGRKTYTAGTISFSFEPKSNGKPLYPLKMIIGFPRPIQLKRLLRDLAGLGTEEIHLVITELGEKSYLKSDLATGEAGYQMLLEGTEQAASTHIPKLHMHSSLKECFDSMKINDGTIKMCLDNVNAKDSLFNFLQNKDLTNTPHLDAVAAIGSERGWTQNERRMLEEAGFTRLSMGCRILRTESAATVAASLILGSMGFLN